MTPPRSWTATEARIDVHHVTVDGYDAADLLRAVGALADTLGPGDIVLAVNVHGDSNGVRGPYEQVATVIVERDCESG